MSTISRISKGKIAWWLLATFFFMSFLGFEPMHKSRFLDLLMMFGILSGLLPTLVLYKKENIVSKICIILGVASFALYVICLSIGFS